MRLKIFASVLVLPILFGCASSSQSKVPRYAAPESGAIATLRSEIMGAYNRHESITIYVSDGECGAGTPQELFYIRHSKSEPGGYVKIAANRPLLITYDEQASAGRACRLALEVKLEEGKTYSLVGGYENKTGPIPVLTDTRMCRLGIQDDAEKTLIPYKVNCSPSN